MEQPRTYNDDVIDEKARDVIAAGLDRLKVLLKQEHPNPELLMGIAQAVDAAGGVMVDEDEDDEE